MYVLSVWCTSVRVRDEVSWTIGHSMLILLIERGLENTWMIRQLMTSLALQMICNFLSSSLRIGERRYGQILWKIQFSKKWSVDTSKIIPNLCYRQKNWKIICLCKVSFLGFPCLSIGSLNFKGPFQVFQFSSELPTSEVYF